MLQHDRIDVLQMHMGHALAELAERFDGVPTAHEVVPDVETYPDLRRIGGRDQACDFRRGLDERSGMWMERQSMTGLDRLVGERVEHGCQTAPCLVREAGCPWLSCPAGPFVAIWRPVQGHA